MPTPLLDAHAAQLHHLEAEEALQAATRTAVGSGSLKPHSARQITSTWQRAVDRPRPALRPRSREAYEAQMAIAGIAVKPVKRDG